jgi:hypothetical protein
MLNDARLQSALSSAAETERAARHHLTVTDPVEAGELARAQAVYRHAIALRKALELWIETRSYRATAVK